MSPWNKWSEPWNMYTHILYTHPVFPMQPGAADALSPPSICYQRLQDPGSQRFADTFCLQPAADWQPGREVPREKRYNRKHFKSSDRLQDKKQDVYIWAIVSLFLHPFPFSFELFGERHFWKLIIFLFPRTLAEITLLTSTVSFKFSKL